MRWSPIAGLGYVAVGTTRIEQWRAFATDVLGMMPSKLPLPPGGCAFRMDDRMARLIVEPDDSDEVLSVGWEVAGRPEWDDLHSRFDKAGLTAEHVTGEAAQQRAVKELLRLEDPSGAVVEFGFQPLCDVIDRFISPNAVRFVTGDQGMGHVTRSVTNYSETVDFYTQVLGFRVRDTIDLGLRATFASPNPRHHSIALMDESENFFRHIMLEVDSIDDMGRCYDRVQAGAAPLNRAIGRHFSDLIISFYMTTPTGFQIEYGYGGRRVDLDDWVENAQGGVGGPSLWGHQLINNPTPPQ